MLRAHRLGSFATVLLRDERGRERISLTDANGGLTAYTRQELKALRKELRKVDRVLRQEDESRDYERRRARSE
jgi:hypothetical protein